MDTSKLQDVDVDCAKLEIKEGENYKLHLTRTLDNITGPQTEVMHLWKCTRVFYGDLEQIHVLAPTKEDAIGQAFGMYNEKGEENAHAEQIPLQIRGWGRTIF